MSQVQNEDTALPLYIRVYNVALLNTFELNINKKDSPEGATYFTSFFKSRFHPDDRLGRLNPFFCLILLLHSIRSALLPNGKDH